MISPDEFMDLVVKKAEGDVCTLFTDTFSRLLQMLLGVSAIAVLYLKRKLERPVRPLDVRRAYCLVHHH